MRFKIITPEILRSCLSGLLINNYNKEYSQFCKFVKLEITRDQFEEFKKREITLREIEEIISKTGLDGEKEVSRLQNIWNVSEKDIVSTMNKISGLSISVAEITCYVDPYQKGGYYGEDNIVVGTYENPEDILFVISHELFHIFYWRKLAELEITKSTMGNESASEWELAEVTVHLITTEPEMRNFWKNIKIEVYPEIEEMYKKVKYVWEKNTFNDYLKEAYTLLTDGS